MKNSTPTTSKSLETKNNKSNPFWRVFWLTFLVVSLGYAWYSFYAPANNEMWQYNVTEAKEIAQDSNKNMVLFFTGTWCVPCKIMKREVFADSEVIEAMNASVIPVMIDIDDPNVQDLVKLYNIGGTPITLFTNAKGSVLDYAVGKMEKEDFLKMLAGVNQSKS